MSQRRGEMALRARADKANQADARAMPLFAVGVSKPWVGSAQDEGRGPSRLAHRPWHHTPGAPPHRPRS